MAHSINGIITSFKFAGELPHVVLVGNFHFIPWDRRIAKGYREDAIPPYDRLSKPCKQYLKELSFEGKCVYIETHYHGGYGTQMASVWENGNCIAGPFFSYDEDHTRIPEGVTVIKGAINQALKGIGIYKHEGMDEFDSVRLGWYRSNDDAVEEHQMKRNM